MGGSIWPDYMGHFPPDYLGQLHRIFHNCEPGKLLVDIDQINDTIFVDEDEEKPMANCICPYDLCYRIGPMDYGQYIIKFQRDGLLFAEFSVYFNSATSGIFEINQ